MKKMAVLLSLLIIVNMMLAFAADSEDIITAEQDEADEVLELTLADSIELALAQNLDLQVALTEMTLQDLQLEITDEQMDDARDMDKDLNKMKKTVQSQIETYQEEKDFLKGLENTGDSLAERWEDVQASSVANSMLSTLIAAFPDEATAKAVLTWNDLYSALDAAIENVSDIYVDVIEGVKTSDSQINIAAAQMLGLKATRKLDLDQALDIINMATEHNNYRLEQAREDLIDNITMLVESSFYEVLKAQKICALQDIAVQRAQEQYEAAQASYEQGLLALSNLQMAKLQLNNMLLQQYSANQSFAKAHLDFCNALGLPLESEYILIEPDLPASDLSLEDGLAIAQANRSDLIQAQRACELAELNLSLVADKHKENTDAYRESLLYQQKAELAYQQTLQQANSEIRKAYLDWQTADYSYQLTQDNLDYVLEQVRIAQVSYDVGYSNGSGSPLSELLAAQEQLANMEQALAAAEFGRNLAWKNFLNKIGWDETVVIDMDE